MTWLLFVVDRQQSRGRRSQRVTVAIPPPATTSSGPSGSPLSFFSHWGSEDAPCWPRGGQTSQHPVGSIQPIRGVGGGAAAGAEGAEAPLLLPVQSGRELPVTAGGAQQRPVPAAHPTHNLANTQSHSTVKRNQDAQVDKNK